MEIIPAQHFGARDEQGLAAFLAHCRDQARTDGQPRLASISLRVPDLDPLAVLRSIREPDEPHLYLERGDRAVSGAEAIAGTTASGPDRFARIRQFREEWTARTIATGDLDGWLTGPLFFLAFAFADEEEPAARVFLPKWQVGRSAEECIAVANLRVEPDTDLAAEGARIWRAHQTFSQRAFPVREGAGPAGEVTAHPEPPELFRARVRQALAALADSPLDKIVVARWMDLQAEHDFAPLETLRTLREAYPGCFAFSYAPGDGSSWIGASPERLVRVEDGRLETEALAGSAPRGDDLASDDAHGRALLESDKDLREHAWVVRAIERRLRDRGIEPEIPAHPGLLRLSNVQHLRTPIRAARPPGCGLSELAAILHPTPAVGGSPREIALPLLAEFEPFPRGLYAGFLGWEKPGGEGELVVALRTAHLLRNHARLYAGAGIVEGSQPDAELRETELKLAALAQNL